MKKYILSVVLFIALNVNGSAKSVGNDEGLVGFNLKKGEKPIWNMDIQTPIKISSNLIHQEGVRKKTYVFPNLSPIFDFKVELQSTKPTDEDDEKSISVSVLKKEGGFVSKVENIEYPSYCSLDKFKAGSEITNINSKFGEASYDVNFLVADFNFDGLADFAVMEDPGGKLGPTYRYFLQKNDGQFYLDEFLTNEVKLRPKVEKNKKCIIVLYSSEEDDGTIFTEDYYRINMVSRKWEFYERITEQEKWKEINNEYKPYLNEVKYYKPRNNNFEDLELIKTDQDIYKDENQDDGSLESEGDDELAESLFNVAEEQLAELNKTNMNDKIVMEVDEKPEFLGGEAALKQYIVKNIKYPAIAKQKKIQGNIYVNFVVNRDGSVTNIRTAWSFDPSLDAEAIRIVSTFPKWKPGKHDGKLVRVFDSVTIPFKL